MTATLNPITRNRKPRAGYGNRLVRRGRAQIAERNAQRAADDAIARLPYPEAVHRVLRCLFGDDWVGPASEQEKIVIRDNYTDDPNWSRFTRLHSLREAQIARADEFLRSKGLIEEWRGHTAIQTLRLDEVPSLREPPDAEAKAPRQRSAYTPHLKTFMRRPGVMELSAREVWAKFKVYCTKNLPSVSLPQDPRKALKRIEAIRAELPAERAHAASGG